MDTAGREERRKAIRGPVAYPKDEIQHENHVLHARADVRKVVASPAIIHHRVTARTRRILETIRVLATNPWHGVNSFARFERCFNSRR